MRTTRLPLILALVLISASQALAKPPLIILPSAADSQLIISYYKAADPDQACTNEAMEGALMWPPPLANINNFFTTFSPVLPQPTCWWHCMQLSNTTRNGRFVDNAGVIVTSKLTLSTSLVLRPLATAIRAAGYSNKQITVLPYDWRLDVNSIEAKAHIELLRIRIQAISRRAGEKAILIGYSQGNTVAMKLLQLASVRPSVKGYIALAPPFGGSLSVIPTLTSGSVKGALPPSMLAKLALPPGSPFTREQLLHSAARGMASFAMLAPSLAGYPEDPVVVTAGGVQYKVSQLPQLFRDIKQGQLADAFADVQQVPITGPLPNGIVTYCIYGSGIRTPVSLRYAAKLTASMAEEPTTAATAMGDSVVALSSLSLCDTLTTPDKVSRLPAPVTHFNVFSHPLGRAALAKALTELSS